VSHDFVARLWRDNGMKPHRRRRSFKLSADDHFETKLCDVVGLYTEPPEGAVVLSIDEKPGVQALDRDPPEWPSGGGHAASAPHNYTRKGTTDLFAAFNTRTGWVTTMCYTQHRTSEFLDFMDQVAAEYEGETETHVIVDNASTHSGEDVDEWLGEHPNFVFHYTPVGSSWVNQVENWFGILTRKALERGVFRSVDDLVSTIYHYVDLWNLDAAPFQWNATADEILAKVEQLHRDYEGLLANNAA
jgi:transposase